MFVTNRYNFKYIILLMFLLVFPSLLFAAPIETVTNTNDAGAGSLRQAITDVNTGGEIVFNLPGPGPHTILITDTLDIDKSLTITGPGQNFLTINGAGGAFRGIQVADGLDTSSKVVISGITLDGGITTFGGILNGEDLTLNNVVITGYGSAVVNFGPSSNEDETSILRLNNSLIIGNSGIGLFSLSGQSLLSPGGVVTINQTTISNNGGPGIVLFGSLMQSVVGSKVLVNKSTVTGNTQGIVNEGAGAAGAVGGTLEVSNSTISNNSGDGIQTNGGTNGGTGGTTKVSSSTITENAFTGVINFGAGPLTEVKNSIIADNAGEDCGIADGVFTPLGVNFNTDGTCTGFTTVSSLQLNLGPLQNNGGPTDTRALIPPSAAIDVLTDCTFISGVPVLEDQRGFFRPETDCDAGAFEFGARPLLTRNVPTMSQWGILLMAILLGITALAFCNKKKIKLVC
ncbi:MAG: CSLREA domain-containing protein [Thermodesulfobacteriota bacterium]|nr:MAG: CSLREA domain-containing protein [Thermodesulfobacteriota bacterium]